MRIRVLSWIGAATGIALGLHLMPAAAARSTTEYQRALALGTEAYVYGYPLLDADRVFRTSTSVNVPNGEGGGPINQFSNVRRLGNPSDKTVVAPNHDTLYSMAWLDLSAQPMVLHMPVLHRFAVFELVDPYTENFALIGGVGHPPGNYAIAGPRWRGRLPHGVKLIRAPYSRVWVIGRTYIRDPADTPNVVRIQNRYLITPLSRWGTGYAPPRPAHPDRHVTNFHVPGTHRGQDPLAFFDALGHQLKRFPPPAADKPLLRKLKAIGVGPGLHPSSNRHLDAATLRGLRDAVAAGRRQITADLQQAFVTGAVKDNGWLVARTGHYGTDYVSRALVDRIGLGAPLPSLAIYPFTITDRNLQPLTGSNRYVAHFSPANLPIPVRAFWSLTLYDSHGFFVPNPAHVYLINDRSTLHYNADGSLDVYIQPHAPQNALQRSNWLPSPAGRQFRLIMRLYLPVDINGIIDGTTWQPPAVLPCGADGRTSTGIACAS